MATQDAHSDTVTARLASLAERRQTAQENAELLADEIRSTVADAQKAGIPMAEVARLLGIDRSTLYRVYASI